MKSKTLSSAQIQRAQNFVNSAQAKILNAAHRRHAPAPRKARPNPKSKARAHQLQLAGLLNAHRPAA
jgi:hypothetical protein